MTPCLFSVSYAGYWGQATLGLPDFIAHTRQLGFPAVMLAGKRPHLSPLDMAGERLEAVRAALRNHGVQGAVVAGYTNLAPAAASEVPALEMQIAYEAFFRGLREGGFDGIAVYEMCSPVAGGGTVENLDAKARAYLAWMAKRNLI